MRKRDNYTISGQINGDGEPRVHYHGHYFEGDTKVVFEEKSPQAEHLKNNIISLLRAAKLGSNPEGKTHIKLQVKSDR